MWVRKECYRDILKLSNKISTVICFGQDRSKIAKDLDELKPQTFKTLKEALFHIQDQLKYPKVNILFSPACASFDEFENFEDRGRFFNDHITIGIFMREKLRSYSAIILPIFHLLSLCL